MSGVASPVMAAGGERAAIRTVKPPSNGTSAQGKGGGRQKAMCHASSAGATPLRGATGKKSGSEVKGGCLAPALLAPGQAHPPLSSSSSSSSSSAKPFTAEEQKLVNELEVSATPPGHWPPLPGTTGSNRREHRSAWLQTPEHVRISRPMHPAYARVQHWTATFCQDRDVQSVPGGESREWGRPGEFIRERI
jgi:hypothetical protein